MMSPSPSRARARSACDAGLLVIGPRVSSGAVVTLCALRHGDEIDQLLDPAEELRLEVGVAGHRPQDALPGRGHLRRPADGEKLLTIAGRSSMPSRYSTTTPTSRRSSPQIFSTSSASCLPST